MSKYNPGDDIEENGRDATNRVVAYGTVELLLVLGDYKSLYKLMNGWFCNYEDYNFYARLVSERASLDFDTYFDVSIWLKQKIREENK
jgi:hypothetical protein